MIPWWLLSGCSGPAPDESPAAPPSPECVSGSFDDSGGVLVAVGATLDVPAGALTGARTLELCPTELGWTLSGGNLGLVAPLLLTIEHDQGAGTAMFSPSPDDAPWRNLQATGGAGAWTGPLYRGGEVFVAADPRQIEPYAPVPSGKADLLFVIDNSCSMFEHQAALADVFPGLSSFLGDTALDYHVGVVSTDLDDPAHSGALREAAGARWIDATTPDPDAVFRELVSMGTSGSGTERGLGATFLALETRRDEVNAGFLRSDAALAVIVVSDEPDYTQPQLITQPELVDWFEGSLKSVGPAAAFHAVAHPQIGALYTKTADETGGLSVDILDPAAWPAFLDEVVTSLEGSDPGSMPLAAVDGSVEGFWVPADAEQQRLAGTELFHDAEAATVWLDAYDLPASEVFVVYQAE